MEWMAYWLYYIIRRNGAIKTAYPRIWDWNFVEEIESYNLIVLVIRLRFFIELIWSIKVESFFCIHGKYFNRRINQINDESLHLSNLI